MFSIGVVLILAAMIGLIADRQVIAAPPPIDQSAGETAEAPADDVAGDEIGEPEDADSAARFEDDASTGATPPPLTVTVGDMALVVLGAGCVWLFLSRRWYRLGKAPKRPAAFSPMVGAGLFVAMFVLGAIGGGIAGRMIGLDPNSAQELTLREQSLMRIGVYLAEVPVLVAYLMLMRSAPRLLPDRRFNSRRCVLVAVGALFLCYPVLLAVSRIVTILVHVSSGEDVSQVPHSTLQDLMATPETTWTIVTIALVTLVAPVLEEVMYRGLIQPSFVRVGMSRWGAIGLTSLAFAAVHITAAPEPSAIPVLIVPLFVLSLAFGWAYEKTGRLTTSILMHVLFNAANVAMAMAYGVNPA